MTDEISQHIASIRRFPQRAYLPGQFTLCLWEKSKDWNRALILEALSRKEEDTNEERELYRVRFVDFGETDIVGRQSLRQLPDQFRELPATAIECSLANCQPASCKFFMGICTRGVLCCCCVLRVLLTVLNILRGTIVSLKSNMINLKNSERNVSRRVCYDDLFKDFSIALYTAKSSEYTWKSEEIINEIESKFKEYLEKLLECFTEFEI